MTLVKLWVALALVPGSVGAQNLDALGIAADELRSVIEIGRTEEGRITLIAEVYGSSSPVRFWSGAALDTLQRRLGAEADTSSSVPVTRGGANCRMRGEEVEVAVSEPMRQGESLKIRARIQFHRAGIPRLASLPMLTIEVIVHLSRDAATGTWLVDWIEQRMPESIGVGPSYLGGAI
jgi:hypothetical protein